MNENDENVEMIDVGSWLLLHKLENGSMSSSRFPLPIPSGSVLPRPFPMLGINPPIGIDNAYNNTNKC